MLEFMICATLTILPNYLIKHFFYGHRWGKEITFFSMWFELRWGITLCIISTIMLITTLFYFHPSTTQATPFFRTITIMPETSGRVLDVHVATNDVVEAGDLLFTLDASSQQAAVDVAEAGIAEVQSQFVAADAELERTAGQVAAAEGQLAQAEFDLEAVRKAVAIQQNLVSERQVEQAEDALIQAEGNLQSALAARDAAVAQREQVLPAQLNSAQEALEQAQAELAKTRVHAGVSGQLVQFGLQAGDVVNPMLRPAGMLVPVDAYQSGHKAVQAGFSQLAANVIKPGTIAEISCLSRPFTVIPMVITRVQPVIEAGQVRATDQLVDIQDRARPGSLMAVMEPLYADGMEGLIPGSRCIGNAYTVNHDKLEREDLSTGQRLFYHVVDTIALVHAAILRIQVLVIPVQALVFDSH